MKARRETWRVTLELSDGREVELPLDYEEASVRAAAARIGVPDARSGVA